MFTTLWFHYHSYHVLFLKEQKKRNYYLPYKYNSNNNNLFTIKTKISNLDTVKLSTRTKLSIIKEFSDRDTNRQNQRNLNHYLRHGRWMQRCTMVKTADNTYLSCLTDYLCIYNMCVSNYYKNSNDYFRLFPAIWRTYNVLKEVRYGVALKSRAPLNYVHLY